MKYSMYLLQNIRFMIILIISFNLPMAHAVSELEPFGMALLRYENEANFANNKDRSRLRLIAQAGLKLTVSEAWTAVGRVSTGLKNKQNVPAITIKRFTEQAQPDNDIYIDQAYIKYQQNAWQISMGRLPWRFDASTDVFWDHNLNPYTIHVDHKINEYQSLSAAFIKPLDGQSRTIGNMFVSQYQVSKKINGVLWSVKPWVALYKGEADARYATRDTQLDHRSLRFSLAAKFKKWRLATDLAYAFVDDQHARVQISEKNQNQTRVVELSWGGLKSVNDWQAHLRYMHVERFSVIGEFAQNAIAAKLTTNFSGWDTRFRYRVHSDIWLGIRLSLAQSLQGESIESNRFRIEGRWAF